MIKGDPTMLDQIYVKTSFYEEKPECKMEIPVHLSSDCQNRGDGLQISDKNMSVRNSRATTVSSPQFRMTREREPSRISYRMVTRLFNRRKVKKTVKLYIEKYVPKSSMLKVMICGYQRHHFLEGCTRSNFMVLA